MARNASIIYYGYQSETFNCLREKRFVYGFSHRGLQWMVRDPFNSLKWSKYSLVMKHHGKIYWVHNPKSKWTCCWCVSSLKENICKHQVQILTMVHLSLVEGAMTRYCRTLKGIASDNIHAMLVTWHTS
jgi:hypothetical protein